MRFLDVEIEEPLASIRRVEDDPPLLVLRILLLLCLLL